MNDVNEVIRGLETYLEDLYKGAIDGLVMFASQLSAEEQSAVQTLLHSCHQSEKAVLALLKNDFVFDADALMRSVYEGSVRTLYILHGSIDDVHSRIKEFTEELPLETYRNLHNRATSILDEASSAEDSYREMVTELSRLGNTRASDKILQRWRFAQMFNTMKDEDWGAVRLSRIQIGYALSSDVLHKGYLTCQLQQETATTDRRHLSRILFSLYDLADMRCEVIAGPSIAAPLSLKHGATVCQILSMSRQGKQK